MKNLFTEKELECGMFIIRNDAAKPLKNLDFAATVVWKVGFIHVDGNQYYGLCSVMTDGYFYHIKKSKKELVDHLNEDDRGYRPLTKDEMIQLLNHSNQGFY